MKRIRNIYSDVFLYPNLLIAFYKAAKNKRDNPEVKKFIKNFNDNIEKIRIQLIKRKPDIGHYRFFTVQDPKRRNMQS